MRAKLAVVSEAANADMKGTVRDLQAALRRLVRAEQYPRALQLAEELARRNPGRSSHLELGRLYRRVGDYRSSIRAFRDALRFRTGPKQVLPEIHVQVAYTWYYLGNRDLMAEALKRAYALARKPRAAYGLHMMVGTDHYLHHRYEAAFECYELAVAAAREPEERARASTNAALALVRMGRLQHAKQFLDRALVIQQRQRRWAELAATRMIAAALYVDLSQLPRALGMLKRAARTFRSAGKTPQEAEALQNLGYIANELGYSTVSLSSLDRAITLAGPRKLWDTLSRAHACRAIVYARQDLFRAAHDDVKAAQHWLHGHRDEWSTIYLARAKARIAELTGDWNTMRREARHGEEVAARIHDAVRVVEFRKLRAIAEEQMGRERAASTAWKNASSLERAWGIRQEPEDQGIDLTKAARSDASLLIVGEAGTGKTELARHLHALSRRRRKKPVVVPCEQLVFPEVELYGYVKGAWTHATRSDKGYARRAHHTTLILDRVDELPAREQRLLVPVLQKKVRPVGSPYENEIDARLIGTCRDFNKLTRAVRDRLGTIIISVPPLRERRADLPFLIRHALRGRKKITCDAIAALVQHDWEGNIIELNAIVERLVVLADDTIGRILVRRVLRTGESTPLRDTAKNRIRRKTLPRRQQKGIQTRARIFRPVKPVEVLFAR